MILGVPSEIKSQEARVALTPEGASEFIAAGHSVIVETAAGAGSAITDGALYYPAVAQAHGYASSIL